MRPLASVAVAGVLASAACFAQHVISARAGLVHYAEGRVLIEDQLAEPKFGHFPQLNEQQILRTEEGRAEILLNPGVFLRLGEYSSIRMLSTLLTAARVEFLSGSMVLEWADLDPDSRVTVAFRDAVITVHKKGLLHLDSDPPELRVFAGEATLELGGQRAEVKEGRKARLAGDLAVEKFDRRQTDALDRWSMRRAEYLAMANVYAARSIGETEAGRHRRRGGWSWNPYLGLLTYVPAGGIYVSPYGFRFYSPQTVEALYRPPLVIHYSGLGRWDASRGYTTIPATSAGTSGTLAAGAAAPTTPSQSSTAPIQRPSGTAGGRDR